MNHLEPMPWARTTCGFTPRGTPCSPSWGANCRHSCAAGREKARARTCELSTEKVWGDLVRGLPQGLPGRGDEGLDRTHTWGRTYWGGALFWLLAEVEIRERTGNRFGLEDALRAIVAQGGSIAERWPLQRALEVGDRAVGTGVLEELYAKMGSAPMKVDLDGLFLRLGVALRQGVVELDDRAPLAPIRRAITERR